MIQFRAVALGVFIAVSSAAFANLIVISGSRGVPPPSPPGATESTHALVFPCNVSGSDTSAPYAVIEYSNPQSNGLPIWGPGNAGVTVVRKLVTRQQTGYYSQFWWARGDGTFDSADGYWGFHPYPQTSNNTGTTHWHEVSIDARDFINSAGNWSFDGGSWTGNNATDDVGEVRRQGIRVQYLGANSKQLTYYTNLPSTASGEKSFADITNPGYGSNPSPKVVIGDSPWYASYQHERSCMDLYGIKIFADLLSEADMLSEAADFSQVVTSAGQASIWWFKNGFDSTTDLTDDYAASRTFTKVDSNNLLTVN